MTEQEMKRLSRAELLEVILMQGKQIEELQAQNADLTQKVEDKTIALNEAGSIAEASLRLNHVFQDAELAVAQYKENIQRLSMDQEAIAQGKMAEAQRRIDQMLAEAQQQANSVTAQAEMYKAKAKMEADAYWAEASKKLENLLNAQAGLRELLNMGGKGPNG